jgi:cytosine/adenosine deaminase-related metal-dependent hydrolase
MRNEMPQARVELLVRNATVITMDPSRRILDDGAIAIDHGVIRQIGTSAELADVSADVELAGKDMIVLPGLINPHIHLSYSLGRGCGDDLPFPRWLPVVYRLEDAYTDDEWYLSSLLSMAEMIKSGTTCFGDTNIYEELKIVAKAVEVSGMRAVLGKIIRDEDSDELRRNSALRDIWKRDHPRSLSVASAVEDWKKWNGQFDGRLSMRLSPAVWPVCSKASYLEAADASRTHGIGSLIHHTETKEWKTFVEREYGKAPTLMLQDFGILGPNTLLENMAWLNDEEIEVLAKSRTPINYLPTSNLKNYLGVLDIRKISDRGIPVSLGTSGGLINNINDMFREMLVLALQQRMLRRETDAIAPETILEMATITAAKTLGLESEIGSLEPGKRADLCMIDTRRPHLVPVVNPVSTVVYCASGSDVDTVVIDGKVVMKERKLKTLDEGHLMDQARRDGLAVLGRTGILSQPQCQCRWPRI